VTGASRRRFWKILTSFDSVQCVSILVNYLERRDWQAAFEATVPQRKRAAGFEGTDDLTIELEGPAENNESPEGDNVGADAPELENCGSEHERDAKRPRTHGDAPPEGPVITPAKEMVKATE